MKTFAMVSTSRSEAYTASALHSFFETTALCEDDRFILIDNDSTINREILSQYPRVELQQNILPLSFSANFNQILHTAREARSDIFFLNNDLIFTPAWIFPFLKVSEEILSPVSNREFQYRSDSFVWQNVLSLDDYLGREAELEKIAIDHKNSPSMQGLKTVLCLPFFCIKIPFSAYNKIGPMDESFGRGGAEDNDYCLRAALLGIPVKYALSSYVLHFNGRSTWAGAETSTETEERCAKFRARFQEKWGTALRSLCIDESMDPIENNSELRSLVAKEDFQSLVRKLAEEHAS